MCTSPCTAVISVIHRGRKYAYENWAGQINIGIGARVAGIGVVWGRRRPR